MAMQPYVHVETLEEYSERFKDFAHLERTGDSGSFFAVFTGRVKPVSGATRPR